MLLFNNNQKVDNKNDNLLGTLLIARRGLSILPSLTIVRKPPFSKPITSTNLKKKEDKY